MKFQFKLQGYQTAAVDAVVNCFAGQPRSDGVSYLSNGELALTDAQLLTNINRVQRLSNLPLSPELVDSRAAADTPNLDVEMETGTGKTYVYIKTIMELKKRYGWTKFIIVVPSIAIREGVRKSFEITAEHFQQIYGSTPRSFVYSSSQLHELERFGSDAGVQVMIINIQAFNSKSKDNRRIYDELDNFQSRRPIDVISSSRPILIIDEPQKIGAATSLESLSNFKALMTLRYSATHKVQHNKVHRLDALDAFNQKLVKRIAVRGITVQGLAGTAAYLYVDAIEIAKGARPRARVEIEVQTKAGPIKRQVKRLEVRSNLHDLSGGIEAYKGLVVIDIDANRDVIELSNGDVVVAGQLADSDVTEESRRRIQIREVIGAHLDKERELFGQEIKVLSLFFIDEVAKYRNYDRDDNRGDYTRVFEEEYAAAVSELSEELALDDAAATYCEYLQRDEASAVHEGYFSIDKKKKRFVDPKVSRRGDDKGQSADVAAYDLILKNKERLLSLAEPVRFIFSHSALREGWDNPNVFVIGMLKKSDNTISRRQEIGRGLRLAVDQHGARVDNPVTVHDINELTVVTDESYTDFVAGLQKEMVESLSTRPSKATPEFFAGKVLDVVDGSDESVAITLDQAKQLQHWLTRNGFIDYNQHLTDKWLDLDRYDLPELPAGLDQVRYQVADLIDSLHVDIPPPANGHKPKRIPINKANFTKKEFEELWDQISHKAVWQVKFDSTELVRRCIIALDKQLQVTPLQYIVQAGAQKASLVFDDLGGGKAFTVNRTTTHAGTATASSAVKYDLLGEIAEKTQLTRRTTGAILQGVQPETFTRYRHNPEQFITESARLISEQKVTVIVKQLTYEILADQHDPAIFTENRTRQDFTKAGAKLTKHIYDYVITDSDVERDFVTELETSTEVLVYAKLPRAFSIPTPLGDYNPDWAIAFVKGTVQHIYFVAETKGSLSSMDLRGAESAKIDCAWKFFESLNAKHPRSVKYGVVTDYAMLMGLVGQK